LDPDDAEYKKSVRNMSVVLAAIVITIFAGVFVSPYIFPAANTFQPSVSLDSPFFAFTLHLQINTTAPVAGGSVSITGWLNSTSSGVANLTASDSWGVGPSGLLTRNCTSGWPIGIGVMMGHYTGDNYTFGVLMPIAQIGFECGSAAPAPSFFLLSPGSSKVLVDINGSPQYWDIQTGFTLGTGKLSPGPYTAIVADEWGDVLTTSFVVS
jgi:hypothetical protein